jgi:preprotein translocase subunit SecD
MRKLLAGVVFALALAAGSPAMGTAQEPEPLLSVHLVTTEIKPGVRLCEQLRTGLKIAYEPDAILALADVDSVSFGREGADGPFSVVLALSNAGRSRLHQVSTDNVGRRIAIIVDDVAHAVPLIRQPLDLDRLPVGYYPDEAEARQLAALLTAALEGK